MEPFGAFFGTKCTPYLEARQKARSGVKGLSGYPRGMGKWLPDAGWPLYRGLSEISRNITLF